MESKLELINIADLIEPLMKDLRNRTNSPELPLQSLPGLSDMVWGIRKRKLTVIGARTSQGKSTFAVQLCYDLALQDKKVVFFSLEMENLECAERLLAHSLEIPNLILMKGGGYRLYERAAEFWGIMSKKNFLISDCIGHGWREIEAMIKLWWENKTVPDVVVLDYIQQVKGDGNDKQVFDEYIKQFRDMAIRYNFAAIICSQVNRTSQDSDDKSPQLHQLKGTGGLEEKADVVFLLHWPWFYDDTKEKNHFELQVAKNKGGPTGWLNIMYEPEFFRFKDISK